MGAVTLCMAMELVLKGEGDEEEENIKLVKMGMIKQISGV